MSTNVAVFQTLITSCLLAGIDPYKYLLVTKEWRTKYHRQRELSASHMELPLGSVVMELPLGSVVEIRLADGDGYVLYAGFL
ncbi:hypothetical protein [Endozoicomonas sp. SESOKO1]|uniref:hypothetical protein n=1 Tax=Endozoicomonas sp. SESOKO1 TaxID=2828742 RepID=UPI002147CFD5|nr:hypothetical protein [Endozoicomonas sp. SESOKO1]